MAASFLFLRYTRISELRVFVVDDFDRGSLPE
jgi:hypothetical protein